MSSSGWFTRGSVVVGGRDSPANSNSGNNLSSLLTSSSPDPTPTPPSQTNSSSREESPLHMTPVSMSLTYPSVSPPLSSTSSRSGYRSDWRESSPESVVGDLRSIGKQLGQQHSGPIARYQSKGLSRPTSPRSPVSPGTGKESKVFPTYQTSAQSAQRWKRRLIIGGTVLLLILAAASIKLRSNQVVVSEERILLSPSQLNAERLNQQEQAAKSSCPPCAQCPEPVPCPACPPGVVCPACPIAPTCPKVEPCPVAPKAEPCPSCPKAAACAKCPSVLSQPQTRPDQCSLPFNHRLKQESEVWVRPLPDTLPAEFDEQTPTRSTSTRSSPKIDGPSKDSTVSLALSSRNDLMASVRSAVQRISGIDDFFHRHNDLTEDLAELQQPWPWAKGDVNVIKEEQRFTASMFESRIWMNTSAPDYKKPTVAAPVSLFAWDTRFSRFRGRPIDISLTEAGKKSGLSLIQGVEEIPPVIQRQDETSTELCNRQLTYNPVLFYELPCPIIWSDDNSRIRWNRAAERGAYNLLKEQQYPSQHLLVPDQVSTPQIDCTKMKYIVLYAWGVGHGVFSRWKGFIRAWTTVLNWDPSRIVIWEHRRMTVVHSVEEDMIEEGISRYLSPTSICSDHPYVLRMLRDSHDSEYAYEDHSRHMPFMKFINSHEDALAPENQDIQFWRFGMSNFEDHFHLPHRKLLFSFKETPFESEMHSRQNEFKQYQRMYHSINDRHAHLQQLDHREHIYIQRDGRPGQDRSSPQLTNSRNYIFMEFMRLMLTAFAFNPTPDISLMTKQLEHHWTSLMWDKHVEDLRNEALQEINNLSTETDLSLVPWEVICPTTGKFDKYRAYHHAWTIAEDRLAAKLLKESGSGWEDSDRSRLPRSIVTSTTKKQQSDALAHLGLSEAPKGVEAKSCLVTPSFDAPAEATDEEKFALQKKAMLHRLRTYGSSAFHTLPHSFGSMYPVGGLVIRRGDKAIEDRFYMKFGQFRPLGMFALKLHEEEAGRTEARRRYEQTFYQSPRSVLEQIPQFRFPAIFVMTDDLGMFEEVKYCAESFPQVKADNATHYTQLFREALEAEKNYVAASIEVSVKEIEALRAEAKEKEKRGEKVDKFLSSVGVQFDPDGAIRHLLPGSCSKKVTPTCSPLSRFVFGGRTVLHNVFAPPACFHPFKRVGFQQFMVNMQFFARNVNFWVGAMDSSMTQTLRTLSDLAGQEFTHPQFGQITQSDTEDERNLIWRSSYTKDPF